MLTQVAMTLTGLLPDHARPIPQADREARRLRRQACRAEWAAFLEAVFDGAPRHPVPPGGGIGPADRTAPRRP